MEAVLHCRVRGIEPPCPPCAAGRTNHCERLVAGHLRPGLQTGFCADTGGGWSLALVAHALQLHEVPAGFSDEAAVMIEPTACAVHAALAAPAPSEDADGGVLAVVIGAGTLGLATVAAIRRLRPDVTSLLCVAKHPEQRRLAVELGATAVVEPGELRRAVRRASGSWILDTGQLTGGAPVVFDCVGSSTSIDEALAVVAPGGTRRVAGNAGPRRPGPHRTVAAGDPPGRALTPTDPNRRRAAGTASISPWASSRRPAWSDSSAPLTPWIATPMPSSTPPPPGAGGRSRWRSTCAARSEDRKPNVVCPAPGSFSPSTAPPRRS